jgi:hypothetical protein
MRAAVFREAGEPSRGCACLKFRTREQKHDGGDG